MITISSNEPTKAIEDAERLGSFFTKERAGQFLREHPEFSEARDAVAWWKDALGRLHVATLHEAINWCLLLVFLAIGHGVHADTLDIEWPEGKHQIFVDGMTATWFMGDFSNVLEYQAFTDPVWTYEDRIFADGTDSHRWTWQIGYPSGRDSDIALCAVYQEPSQIRLKCY